MDLIADDIARLTYLVLILLAVSGWFISSIRGDLNKTFQRALVWFLIFVGLMGVYGLWSEIEKKTSVSNLEHSIEIKKSNDGHFYTRAMVNNQRVNFLVDTGASSTILSSRDAKKAGVNLSELSFSSPIQTAAGLSYTAIYVVEHFEWLGLELGPRRLLIASEDLFISLLGMDIIDQATSFTISGDNLEIKF